MEQRLLAQTDLTVSRLCLGTMTFGSQVDEPAARQMVDYCFDQGVNFFDTANVYNQGLSEEILGRCLAGRRNSVVLASKARGAMGEPTQYEGLSRTAIRQALEDSLRRLGTDYLDLYYLHAPDDQTPVEESVETLDELRREGKIRYGATSNYAAWQLAEILSICEKNSWQALHVAQPMYNAITRDIEQELIPFAQRFEMSLVVYNPLAGGLLTGKQSRDRALPGTRFDVNQQYRERYWHNAYFDAVAAVQEAAIGADRSPLDLSFRWLMQQESVDSVILGASRMEHLQANVGAACSPDLDSGTIAALDEAWLQLRGPVPRYNR